MFRYKGEPVDVRDVGNALGVTNILEGSIRRAGDDLRITAQLVRTSDGFHLWSETYNRKMENVFEIQEDIAQRIAAALQTPLGVAVIAADDDRRNIPLDVYEKFLRARALLTRRSDYVDDSIRLFREVIEIAPNFADAWAGLSIALEVAPYYIPEARQIENAERYLTEARVAAERALELAPDAATSNHAMGVAYRDNFEWAKARVYLEKAIELDPNNGGILEDYAEFLHQTGQFEKALPLTHQMLRLDPFVPLYRARLREYYEIVGDLETALDQSRKIVELDPESVFITDTLLTVLIASGNFDQAAIVVESGNSSWTPELFQEAVAWLAGPDVAPNERIQESFMQANAFAMLGDRTKYFLARTVQRPRNSRAYWFLEAVIGGDYERANEPEFKSRIVSIRLPEYWREHGWPDMCRAKGDDDFECGHF